MALKAYNSCIYNFIFFSYKILNFFLFYQIVNRYSDSTETKLLRVRVYNIIIILIYIYNFIIY